MLEGRKIYEKRLIQKLFTYTDSEEKTNLCEKLQDARKQGFMMEKYAAMRMVYLDHNLDVEIPNEIRWARGDDCPLRSPPYP